MALIDAPPLLEHVIRLGSAGVRSAVGVDIGADVGEKVCTIARLADCGCETLEFATVVLEDFAVAGEVVLFQGRGCEGGFGVEEAGELGDEGVTLFELVLLVLYKNGYACLHCTYSFEKVFQLRFKSLFFFRGCWWRLRHGGILGVGMEKAFSLRNPDLLA